MRLLIATVVFAIPDYACHKYVSRHVGLGIMLLGERLGVVQRAPPANYGGLTISYSPSQTFVAVPKWFIEVRWLLTLTILALPGLWLALFVYHRLGFRNTVLGARCQICGYDLTGNISGVCPECGVHT
ncbi:MAG TPA: hypothetical protein VGM03_09515 [Phycisphaerae bacterium]|jgi:hypothetical protein